MSDVNCAVVPDAIPDAPRPEIIKNQNTVNKDRNPEKCEPVNHKNTNEPREESNDSTNRKSSHRSSRTKKKSSKSSGTINIIGSTVHLEKNTNIIFNQNLCSKEPRDKSKNKETRVMPDYIEKLCKNRTKISSIDISEIAGYIGDYRELSAKLGFLPEEIDQLENDYRFTKEIVAQILSKWSSWKTSEATIGALMEAMWSCKEYNCAERFAKKIKSEQ